MSKTGYARAGNHPGMKRCRNYSKVRMETTTRSWSSTRPSSPTPRRITRSAPVSGFARRTAPNSAPASATSCGATGRFTAQSVERMSPIATPSGRRWTSCCRQRCTSPSSRPPCLPSVAADWWFSASLWNGWCSRCGIRVSYLGALRDVFSSIWRENLKFSCNAIYFARLDWFNIVWDNSKSGKYESQFRESVTKLRTSP